MEEIFDTQGHNKRNSRALTSLKDLKIFEQEDIIIEFPSSKQAKCRIQSRGHLVFDQSSTNSIMEQNFTKVDREKTLDDRNMLVLALRQHFVFQELIEYKQVVSTLLDKFFCCQVLSGQYLIQEGDQASAFFILEEGLLEVEIGGKTKRKIEPLQGFGQLALLHNCKRSASIKAVKSSILWALTRNTFKQIVQQTFKKHHKKARRFVQKLEAFDGLTVRQKDSIANIIKFRTFEKSQNLGEQGKPIQNYMFLEKGKIKLYQSEESIQSSNQIEQCILDQMDPSKEYRECTVKATVPCSVYQINKKELFKLFGRQFHKLAFRNKVYPHLLNSIFVSKLPKNYIQKIVDAFEIQTVVPGQIAVDAGRLKKNMIFLIVQEYPKDQEIVTLYGQQSLLQQNEHDIYKTQVVITKPSYLIYTNHNKINEAIGVSFQSLYKKEMKYRDLIEKNRKKFQQFRQYSKKLRPQDLYHVKKLANGSSAGVHLVVDKQKRYFFALKCVEKQYILKNSLEKSIQQERKALQMLESPFLMQYGRNFKDKFYMSFLTEFIDGMEFFDVIREMGLVSPKDSRFYAANIIFALEHLHKMDIIYRGLKPENILVCADGYLKLTDMKTCKTIIHNKMVVSKTFTMVGTPHYMAPQILSARGYNHSVDLWSLGVLLYELVCGSVPFGAYTEDPYDIYESILKKELKFPSDLKDIKCKHMIQQLLSRFPQTRLKGSYSSLKSHAFFNGLEWQKLYEHGYQAPYKVADKKLISDYLPKINLKKLKTLEQHLSGKCIKSTRASTRMSTLINSFPNWDHLF